LDIEGRGRATRKGKEYREEGLEKSLVKRKAVPLGMHRKESGVRLRIGGPNGGENQKKKGGEKNIQTPKENPKEGRRVTPRNI